MKKLHGIKLIFSVLLTGILLAGCGEEVPKPVAITEGVDKCDVCNMLVADDQHATEIILQDGKTLKFDDIGCLAAWVASHGSEQVAVQYVRDYHSKEWINLNEAVFAYDKEFQTPMAYGVYSFKDRASAEQFVKTAGKGTIMSSAELHSHHWERNTEMMKQMKHGHSHETGHTSDEGMDTHKGQ